VDGRSSVIRNLLRLVDGPLTGYVAGIISVIASPRNQRLGDLAAGTVVIREGASSRPSFEAPAATAHPDAQTWDVSAVSAEELAAVRRFLDRRRDLSHAAREQIAWDLTARLRDVASVRLRAGTGICRLRAVSDDIAAVARPYSVPKYL
jgi:hypothetical protein